MALAAAVLALHVLVIGFNLFGVVAAPLGARLGWGFVHVAWWRLLHLASMAVVAVQALAGRACFLTIWQDALEGGGTEAPLLMRLVNRLVYWPLPIWAFTVLYVAVFAYTLALLRLVPLKRGRKPDREGPET
jgi:hypothetical protein